MLDSNSRRPAFDKFFRSLDPVFAGIFLEEVVTQHAHLDDASVIDCMENIWDAWIDLRDSEHVSFRSAHELAIREYLRAQRPTKFVILTSDTDCDGTSYGAHLIDGPESLIFDPDAALRFAIESEQMSCYYDCADEVMSLAAFKAAFWGNMDDNARDYFTQEGYTSRHMAPRWNPWVADDSLGTVLDHTYDD